MDKINFITELEEAKIVAMHKIDRCNTEYKISRVTKLSVPKVKIILRKYERRQEVCYTNV